MKQVNFELFPTHTLHLGLFHKVSNSGDIMTSMLSGSIQVDAAFINPELVLNEHIILVAANKALHAQAENKLMTKNIFTELVFNLSPNRNISDSLKKFGLQRTGSSLLVAIIDATPEKLKNVVELIKGEEIPLEGLSGIQNLDAIAKEYQINNKETGSMQREVINIIATKGL